ncbi:TPR repeat protein [Rhizobium paknamense]|uniref:TPR repeat protein n=1 Tax=Rhizobium paknamense TaxID=1206817 RepID=A0ABU0IIM0_9HYPH|nr:tetratricopeptide repeat protein [Rhizobium paknamense]MDQ0458100.1 TPR repeat protein [Rhizobium paknamense]
MSFRILLSSAPFLLSACLAAPMALAQVQDAAPLEPVSEDETAPGQDVSVPSLVTVPPPSGEAGKMQRPSNGADQPAGGITLMERMGLPLPDLPPEKPFAGKVDEAYGAFQRGLFGTAFDKALPLAQKGDPAAQTLIGELISRGLAVKRDMKGAAFWYGEAAKGGDPSAMFKYALMLMEGRFVQPDRPLAEEYMHKAADAGNASAQFNWGQILVSRTPGEKGLREALPYYEKSAEQGIADAQYAVSQIYRRLPGLPQEKRAKARSYLERAARSGFDTAQLDMGIWLINGIEGPIDLEGGFKWLRIAAIRGNVSAQNRLSHAYVLALGTRPNPVEAAKWYILSRRAGLNDPGLEDFYLGLPDSQQKQALEAANKFRANQRERGGKAETPANSPKAAAEAKPQNQPRPGEIKDLPGVSLNPSVAMDDDDDAPAKGDQPEAAPGTTAAP